MCSGCKEVYSEDIIYTGVIRRCPNCGVSLDITEVFLALKGDPRYAPKEPAIQPDPNQISFDQLDAN